MSENVNPLLFSATSSVFDNLSSSAILRPPQSGGSGSSGQTGQSSAEPGQSSVNAATVTATTADTQASAAASIQTPFTVPPIPLTSDNTNPYSGIPSSNSFRNSVSATSLRGTSPFRPASNSVSFPLSAPNPPFIPATNTSFNLSQTNYASPQPPAAASVTPSISPAITPNITPRRTPCGTPAPVPPIASYTPPAPPPTLFPGPPMPPFVGGAAPPPPTAAPSNMMPPYGTTVPPPLPLGATTLTPGYQTLGNTQTPLAPPSAAAQTNRATPATAASSLANHNWTPPIYGVTPEQDTAVVPPSFEQMAAGGAGQQGRYRPVIPHWFFLASSKPLVWKPFSFTDSINLEEAHRQGGCGLVSTDGGRYDVEVSSRVRRPVYWGGPANQDAGNMVRRCSWFKKAALDASDPQPYEEEIADTLESGFRECVESGMWQRQVEVAGDCPGMVLISSPHSMQHYSTSLSPPFPTSVSISESQAPDMVKRGADDFAVSDGEAEQVDHLLFLVHGIGSVCDLSFRSVEECVDTFRELGSELVASHFQQSVESGAVGRVEVLPVSWHKALHSDADGIDERLKPITLRSIPLLRDFTNDTILDVLLYTSPAYCQLIIDTVSSELNRMYRVFCSRHPNFLGGVSVAGHSLGSVILLDLLMHQKPVLSPPPHKPSTELVQKPHPSGSEPNNSSTQNPSSTDDSSATAAVDKSASHATEATSGKDSGAGHESSDSGTTVAAAEEVGVEMLQQRGVGSVITPSAIRARRSQADLHSSMTSAVNFEMGTAGTGQPSIAYPQLLFQPQAAFLLGSPVAMFLTVRGLTQLSPQYRLPTCPHVFNIFHPYDPVAYRLETLIHPHLTELRPLLVPHHKGRKRLHLELKETLERVGSDIKHRIVDSIQSTWNKLYYLYTGTPTEQQQEEMEQEVEQQLGRLHMEAAGTESGGSSAAAAAEEAAAAVEVGQLNSGRRIDYVLQEKPYESFTEYIFALQAHLSYWKSEDTLLLMLKEIYGSMGISSDVKTSHGPSSSSFPSTPRRTSATFGENFSATSVYSTVHSSNGMAESSSLHSPPAPPSVIPMLSSQTVGAGGQLPGPAPPAPAVATFPPALGFPPAGPAPPVKVLAGRPVMDISSLPTGMDPTAEPQQPGSALPPPPTGTKLNFTRKSALKR